MRLSSERNGILCASVPKVRTPFLQEVDFSFTQHPKMSQQHSYCAQVIQHESVSSHTYSLTASAQRSKATLL